MMERYFNHKNPRSVPVSSTPPGLSKFSFLPQITKINSSPSYPNIKGNRNLSSPVGKKAIEPISNRENARVVGLDDFSVTRVLGKGSFATVRLAVHQKSNENFAIKTYEKSKLSSSSAKKALKTEIKILKFLDHPKIIKLHEIRDSPLCTHLILEFFNGISLEDYVKQRRKLEENDAVLIFKQVLTAISYMHTLKIAHRDIKLGNILIDSQKKIKIIDFGFATHTLSNKKFINCGTPHYMAPEIVLKKYYDPLKADI